MKFSQQENEYIRRVAKNVNQKIRRAAARGEKDLPNLMSVKDLKAQFSNKQDLKREVAQYERILNNKEALQRRATKDGTISNWRFDYITKNLRATKRYINREIEKQRIILKDYPDHLYAVREKINKLEDEREIINRELDKLTASEIRTVGTVVDRYKRRDLKTIAGRNYFMRNLDALLAAKGLKKDDRRRIKDKLDKLTNEEFEELYQRHDVVSNIMSTIPSYEEDKLTKIERFEAAEKAIEDENVSQDLELFEGNIDEYVAEAKAVVKDNNMLFDATDREWLTKEEYRKKVIKGIKKGTF